MPVASTNSLPPPNFSEFCERVRCLAALHNLSVTSWGRTESRNFAVGGHERSWHRWARGAMGCDLAPDTENEVGTADLTAAARDARLLGMDAVLYKRHVHLEPRGS